MSDLTEPPPLTREDVVGICLDFEGDLPTVAQRTAIVQLRDSDKAQRLTIERLERALDEQKCALDFFLQSKESLLQSFCNLQVTYGEQKHEIRNLKADIIALKRELAQAQGNYAIQKAAADDWEAQWRKTNAQHEAAAKAVTRQAGDIEQLKREKERLETDVKEACGELMVSLEESPPGSLVAKLVLANRVLRSKLATAQARVVELETELDAGAWKISPAMAQATIDRLQATLVEREERIRQLSVANQYFAMSEEALAKQRDALNATCMELAERVTELEGDFMVVTEQRRALTTERDAAMQDAAHLRARLAMLEEEV